MTALERAVLSAIDARVARHDAEVEVLIKSMRSALHDLMAEQSALQVENARLNSEAWELQKTIDHLTTQVEQLRKGAPGVR